MCSLDIFWSQCHKDNIHTFVLLYFFVLFLDVLLFSVLTYHAGDYSVIIQLNQVSYHDEVYGNWHFDLGFDLGVDEALHEVDDGYAHH